MDLEFNYDAWWLEEVKENYKLFKCLVSVVFAVFCLQSAVGITFNPSGSMEGIPTGYLLIFLSFLGILLVLM